MHEEKETWLILLQDFKAGVLKISSMKQLGPGRLERLQACSPPKLANRRPKKNDSACQKTSEPGF